MNAIITEQVLKMRFLDIYDDFKFGRLNTNQAAHILGMSVRSFLRKRRRFEGDNFNGNFDLRINRSSNHKAADAEIELVTQLYNNKFKDFSVKHFHEFATREFGLNRSYSWTKNILFEARLINKKSRGGKHRIRRERKPMEGMMIHQDGSTHMWIEALGYNIDLIVTMDDATSKITSAFFVGEEGTQSSLRGIKETIENYGVFCSFYTDRGSHYFNTPKAGGKVDKGNYTQVGRALQQLGIKHIASYCPQGRGRSERMFGTLQGRLPQELKLAGIENVDEANKYLKDVYLPRHNAQFEVNAKDAKSAYMDYFGVNLGDILCIKKERKVQNDNTIRYGGLILQIAKNDFKNHYVRNIVDVHEYEDGYGIFFGNLCLGKYDRFGDLKEKKRQVTHRVHSHQFPEKLALGNGYGLVDNP